MKRKLNNKGMSLVEVVVAFAVLMIGIAGLYRASVFAMNQLQRAQEIQQSVDQVTSEYYEGKTLEDETMEGNLMFQFEDQDKETFSFPLDIKRHASLNEYYMYYFGEVKE